MQNVPRYSRSARSSIGQKSEKKQVPDKVPASKHDHSFLCRMARATCR